MTASEKFIEELKYRLELLHPVYWDYNREWNKLHWAAYLSVCAVMLVLIACAFLGK